MRLLALVSMIAIAAGCDEARRAGPPPLVNNRPDAQPRTDARADEGDAGLLPGQDARPFEDAADPRADARPFEDARTGFDDAQTGFDDAQAGFDDAQTGFNDAQAGFPDAQGGFPDAQGGFPDAAPQGQDAGPSTNASLAIAQARALPNGPAGIVVDGALVTFVRLQAVGNEAAGFVVQADRTGPALWIEVDPTLLPMAPAVGDRVRFTIDAMDTHPTTMMRHGDAVSSYTRLSSGNSIAGLVQDVSASTDLVSSVIDYEAELVRSSATIASGFRGAGSFFQSARVDTQGVSGSVDLEIRLPTAVVESLGLGLGCTFTVQNPLWRFVTRAQLQAFSAAELMNLSCPPPRLVTASAPRSTRVILSFDRPIASPVSTNQITIGGLGVTNVRVLGNNLIVTTVQQQPGVSYSITVGPQVRDVRGNAVDPNFRSASFAGAAQGAVVRINEVNANVASGCDLVELRAIAGGSLDGWTLRSRDIVMATFSGLSVGAGEHVVVHGSGNNATCNPGGQLGGESFPSQNARSFYPTNFDSAYDYYSTQGGIVNTDTVLTLSDANGNMADVVFLTDAPTGPSANATEDAAQLAASVGEWTTPLGTVPSGGFVDDSFNGNAAVGLASTGAAVTGDSIYRTSNVDTDTMSDWTLGPSTWGFANPGQ